MKYVITFALSFVFVAIGCGRQERSVSPEHAAQDPHWGESRPLPPHMVRVCNVGVEESLFYCYRGDLVMVVTTFGVGGDWRCSTWQIQTPDRVWCYVGKPISVHVAGQTATRHPPPPGCDPHVMEFTLDEYGQTRVSVTP